MSSERESQKCPFCDRVFSEPEYEKPRNSVIAHAVSLADDQHKGFGYVQVRRMIDDRSESDDDNSESTTDVVDEGPTVDADQGEQARTDGAGLGLGGPVPIDDQEEDAVDEDPEPEPETVDCPSCHTDTELTPEEHEQGQKYRCDDCGGRYKWT